MCNVRAFATSAMFSCVHAYAQSVVVSHRMNFTQHFHSLLNSDPTSPHQNIVVLDTSGWTGIEQTMEDLRDDPVRTQRIAGNTRKTFSKCVCGAVPETASAQTSTGTSRPPPRSATGVER